MKRLVVSVLGAVVVAGCGVGVAEDDGASVEAAQDELSTTRSAKASGLTVWLDKDVSPVERGGATVWVLRGHASGDLTGAFSFICDDALGAATLTDARTFEIAFEWRDFEVALAPRSVYLSLTTAARRDYYATYSVAPRLTTFSGSSSIWVDANLVPHAEADGLHWVGAFTTSKAATAANVYNDIDTDPGVTQLAPKSWDYAWPNTSQMLSMPMGGAPLFFRADFANGTSVTKRAQVVVSVPALSLSTQAPY